MSTNLDAQQVTAGQAQKEVTINAATGRLDAAMTEVLALDFTSADITLTNTQLRTALIFRCTNVAAARDLNLPVLKRGLFIVDNSAGANAVTVVVGTTEITVNVGKAKVLFTDGTTNGLFEGGGGGGDNVTFPFFIAGLPGDNELTHAILITASIECTLPSGLTGSAAYCEVDPDSAASFTIQKNGVPIGTVDFTPASQVGAFTFSSDVDLDAGDVLQLVAPTPQDTDLENVSITIVANKA